MNPSKQDYNTDNLARSEDGRKEMTGMLTHKCTEKNKILSPVAKGRGGPWTHPIGAGMHARDGHTGQHAVVHGLRDTAERQKWH